MSIGSAGGSAGHAGDAAASFGHAEAIWREFPQLVAGVLVAGGIRADVEADAAARPWHDRARQRLVGGNESELPEIAAWRRAYARMGLKPTQYRSAAEALLRRFRREGTLPCLHPLVDLCNALSVAFALPVAVFDLDGIAGSLQVRQATGDERYDDFGGGVETPEPGEVIFADAANYAHARRWTFRQSRRSTVSLATRRVLIVSEGLHEGASADVPTLVDALRRDIAALWGSAPRSAILTEAAPRVAIAVES